MGSLASLAMAEGRDCRRVCADLNMNSFAVAHGDGFLLVSLGRVELSLEFLRVMPFNLSKNT
jgi:hypothetical protein